MNTDHEDLSALPDDPVDPNRHHLRPMADGRIQPRPAVTSAERNLAFGIFALMGIVIPAGLTWLGWKPHAPVEMLLIPITLSLYFSAMMLRELLQPVTSQLRSFFYAFAYVAFGASPIPQFLNDRYPWRGNYGTDEVFTTYFFIIAGVITFEIACWLWRRRSAPSAQPISYRPVVPTAVILASASLMAISLLIFFGTGRQAVLFSPRMEASQEIYGQVGAESVYQILIRSMHGFSLVGSLMLVLAAWDHAPRATVIRMGLRAFALLMVGYTLVLANPISTARSWFATVFIAFAGITVHLLLPRLRRYFGPITALGYLFVFPVADVYRSQYDLNAFQQNQMYSVTDNIREGFFNGDFDCFQQVMNARRAADAQGYQYGRQMLGTVLFWFPRSIWPDKPINSGDWVAASVGYGYTNLSCPLWAEGIVDFGAVGTLVYLAAYGWLIQWVFRREQLTYFGPNYYFIATLILSPYSIYLLRGGLLSCVAYITPALLAIVCLQVIQKFAPAGRL